MQSISSLVKITIPDYLASLPIPDTFGGWFKLSFKDWLALVPPTALVAGLGYMSYRAFCPLAQGGCSKANLCNQRVRKHEAKVVDTVNIEDIADKAAYCRCWKTKNWPYCDGSHGQHNTDTGDNVGPLIVKKRS